MNGNFNFPWISKISPFQPSPSKKKIPFPTKLQNCSNHTAVSL